MPPLSKSAAIAFKLSAFDGIYNDETCSFFNVAFLPDGPGTPVTTFATALPKFPINPIIIAGPLASLDADLPPETGGNTYDNKYAANIAKDFKSLVPIENRHFCAKTLQPLITEVQVYDIIRFTGPFEYRFGGTPTYEIPNAGFKP